MNAPPPVTPPQWIYRAVLAGSLACGAWLWFDYFTDYSLAGTLPDLLFPPCAALAATILLLAARRIKDARYRRAIRLASVPALLGGSLAILTGLFAVAFSPLGVIFTVSE